ncbi:hypothetical protein A4W93_21555 [Piscinibacter gummiphilus]|uniref:DUF4440 domain-containing protein n=2 Tax=Piscinibacter gummiphilus TaxID=946333 RepID=A0A1W6LDI0_9BURK|nr:hypothetical protein A4W93_21555 [Piscinibacter gummiphilus]
MPRHRDVIPAMSLSPLEIDELTRLEEAMWSEASRYDAAFQERRFADDFFEFGRSGRTYARAQAILPESAREVIRARLPLDALAFRRLDTHTIQVTYNSHVEYEGVVEHARRSSLWTWTEGAWVMRFHQGTPYEP